MKHEFWSDFNQRPPRLDGTVRKRLFPTPVPSKLSKVQRTSTSPSLLTTSTITNQFFSNQHPPVTPQVIRGNAVSTRKRPSVVNIEGTPSVRKRIVCSNPEVCHARQATDLTAWLNYELLHPLQPSSSPNGLGNFPQHILSQDNDFLNQLAGMHRVFHSDELQSMRIRLVKDLRELPIDSNVDLSPNGSSRRLIVSHILLSYHPAWLLPGLCVMFDTNLAVDLDAALYTARNTNPSSQDHFTLMQFLEDVLYTAFLSPHRHVFSNVAQDISSDVTSPVPPLVAKKNFHRLILERILELVFLLDFSCATSEIFIHGDPPLFRHDSSVTSSREFVSVVGRALIGGDRLQSLLHRRQYTFQYRMPKCETRRDLHISDLAQDLRDGIRLCKLAVLFTKDRSVLGYVRVPSPQNMQKEIQEIRLHNIQLAMRTLLKFAYKTTSEPVEWYALPKEVATGNLPTILPFLWQLVAMWRDSVLFNTADLSAELEVVKDKFRKNRRKVPRMSQSPTAEMCLNELSPSIQSPSNLCIYEKCNNPNSSLLLAWSAVVCGMYGLVIRDFSASFRDGAALSLMLHFYHPEIIKSEEIVHVAAAEVRAPEAAEAEMVIAQNNFDLFVNRLRIIGAFPNVHISAESALGGDSLSSEKQQSFGRLMDIILAYLFRHIMSSRVSDVQERVELLLEESKMTAKKDLAARLITKSLKHLHVLKRLELMGTTPKSCTSRSTISSQSNRSPSRLSSLKPAVFSPSIHSRSDIFPESHPNVLKDSSRKTNVYSSAKPPRHGGFKMTSFLSPSKNDEVYPKKNFTAVSDFRHDRAAPHSDPLDTIRRLRDDTARRMDAATTISNYYRSWRARRVIDEKKKSNYDTRSLGKECSVLNPVNDKLFRCDNASNTVNARTSGASLFNSPMDALRLAEILSPVNSGIQLTMNVLPRVQDHMMALGRFIGRMESEEEQMSKQHQFVSTSLEIARPESAYPLNVAPASCSPVRPATRPSSPQDVNVAPALSSPDHPTTQSSSTKGINVAPILSSPDHHPTTQSSYPIGINVAPILSSPDHPTTQPSSTQVFHNENVHRKTWRELAISAAAVGVNFLAQTVFNKLADITNNVDSTLHEGHPALYMSARKPPSQAMLLSNAPSRHVATVKERSVYAKGRYRPVPIPPLEATGADISSRDSDDDYSPGRDNTSISQEFTPSKLVKRCNEVANQVVEVSARKDQLNGMLAKIRREETDDEISHRQSISRIEQQLSDLDRTSAVLFDKLEYVQELSSKCEKAFNMVDVLGSERGSSRSSRGSMSIFEEYEKSILMIKEERLAARLCDAEEAFRTAMTGAELIQYRRGQLVSKLDKMSIAHERIFNQFKNELNALDKVSNSLHHEYISSCSDVESVVCRVEHSCEAFLESLESVLEPRSLESQFSIPDVSNVQSLYSITIAERVSERLNQAEDTFVDEYREIRLFSLKQWLNRTGYVVLLRELYASAKLDLMTYEEQMANLNGSISRIDEVYQGSSHWVSQSNREDFPQLDIVHEEPVSLDVCESPLQSDFVCAVQSQREIFDGVMVQRVKERVEMAEERFMEEIFARRAGQVAAWCAQKEKEVVYRSADEKLALEESAASGEYEASLKSLPWVDFDQDSGIIHSCFDNPCDFASDVVVGIGNASNIFEYSDELSADYDSSGLEYVTALEEIRKTHLKERFDYAQECYSNYMANRRAAFIENWLQKMEIDIRSRELSAEVEEVDRAEQQMDDDSTNKSEEIYYEANEFIHYSSQDDTNDFDSADGCTKFHTAFEDEDHDSELLRALEVTDIEFDNILSLRLYDSLEHASDRFNEELLQRRLRRLAIWLTRKNLELGIRELNVELAHDEESHKFQMHALNVSAGTTRCMYENAAEDINCSGELETISLYGVSDSSFSETLPVLAGNDDSIHDTFQYALHDYEISQESLLKERLFERHCHAQQEFQHMMSSLRHRSINRWVEKAEFNLGIRELDEELDMINSDEDETAEFSELVAADMTFRESRLSLVDYPDDIFLYQVFDEGQESIDEGLNETSRLYEEICAERVAESISEGHDISKTVFAESAICGNGEVVRDEHGKVQTDPKNERRSVEVNARSGMTPVSEDVSEIFTSNIPHLMPSLTDKTPDGIISNDTARKSLPESVMRANTVMNNLSNSLSIFISRDFGAPSNRSREDDDFVSLSSFATSKNSSKQSPGNDFVSLSSLGTSRFSSAMYGKPSPNVFGSHFMETPAVQGNSASFGDQRDYNGDRWLDSVSPGIALWRIGDTPVRNREEVLGRLSEELDAIGKDMSPDGIDMIMSNRYSASHLQGVMRRISIATGSPFVENNLNMDKGEENSLSFVGFVRMVLVVMRSCVRSDEHITLVQLGMKIMKDVCIVQQRIRDVIHVEESVDVISTCVQLYRDDKNIFSGGVEVLYAISKDDDGKVLLKTSEDVVSRLTRVKEVMVEHLNRSKRIEMRSRQANIVKDILARRKGQKVVGSLAKEIRKMQENDTFPKNEFSEAVQKLEEVVTSCQ